MDEACTHDNWGVDPQGQHWCLAPLCRLIHDFPHHKGQSDEDCGHVQDIYLASAFGGKLSPLLSKDHHES